MHVVLRGGFIGGGEKRIPGELVDASDWRNVDVLISQNFLRLATPDEIAAAEEIDPAPRRGTKPTVKRKKPSNKR